MNFFVFFFPSNQCDYWPHVLSVHREWKKKKTRRTGSFFRCLTLSHLHAHTFSPSRPNKEEKNRNWFSIVVYVWNLFVRTYVRKFLVRYKMFYILQKKKKDRRKECNLKSSRMEMWKTTAYKRELSSRHDHLVSVIFLTDRCVSVYVCRWYSDDVGYEGVKSGASASQAIVCSRFDCRF